MIVLEQTKNVGGSRIKLPELSDVARKNWEHLFDTN
jgi:hypothetical protein